MSSQSAFPFCKLHKKEAPCTGSSGHLGLYRLETQTTAGNGKLTTSGLGSNAAAREALKVAFDYYKANIARVSAGVKAGDHNYHLHLVEMHNTGPTKTMTLAGPSLFAQGCCKSRCRARLLYWAT
jgi:ATP-dependent Lon protease